MEFKKTEPRSITPQRGQKFTIKRLSMKDFEAIESGGYFSKPKPRTEQIRLVESMKIGEALEIPHTGYNCFNKHGDKPWEKRSCQLQEEIHKLNRTDQMKKEHPKFATKHDFHSRKKYDTIAVAKVSR